MGSSSELVVVSDRLRVIFDRHEDRWGHRVEWRTEDGRFVPLLESVEGSPHEEAVPSPPMQDLTMQQLPDAVEVALGVGMAGRNHWSIAFTPARGAHGRAEDDGLAFALACRLREHVPELRSSYRVIRSLHEVHLEPQVVELSWPNVRLRIHTEAELRVTDGGFSIGISPPSDLQTPYTRKWSYGISYVRSVPG